MPIISQVKSASPQGQIRGKNGVLSPNPELFYGIKHNEIVKNYILKEARIKGVNPILAEFIVRKESRYGQDMIGDDGNSRGYWQISKIYHPEVSDKCANNLKCSTEWSLNHILDGKIMEWSTIRFCKKMYQDCPI